MNDDEGEDASGSSATRYPCMPSLVALQQMRNRLHLAYVGKKLMKWTAQATGRELRRLAWDLNVTSDHFSEDMCDAYMLLARARYFCPNLNKMVLEHVGRMASITIDGKTKSIAGVKVLHVEILDNGIDPYQHLGIAKGGQAILEAKTAWRLMLRRVILILEQRTSFALVDEANKNATKRSNVLKRQIIPRIITTIDYIIHELEEIEREDVYRIKLIKNHKLKLAQASLTKIETQEDTVCPICAKTPQVQTVTESEEEVPLPIKQEIMKEHDETEKEAIPCGRCRIRPSNEAYIPMSSQSSRTADPLKLLTTGESSSEIKVDVLKKQLNDVILMSKMFLENGVSCMNVKHFLQACENVKVRIEKICSDNNKEPSEIIDDQMKIKLENLKTHLRKVIEITKEFKNDKFLSPSVDNFARICQEVDDKINIYMKKVESQPVTDGAKSHLYDLKSQIKDVVELTEKYKEQGFLKPSVEKFLHSCEVVKSKIIDLCTKQTVNADESKLDQLKMHLKDLEIIATDVKRKGLSSPSLENFLTSCKEFKAKLDDYNNKDRQPPTEGGLHKLVSQLDETISLTKEAKKSGLISGSVDDFIKYCESTKMKIKLQEENISKPEQPKVIDLLKYSIDDVIKLVNKCQAEGLVTKSIENFIQSLELTKARIDANKSSTDSEFRIVHTSYGEACICDPTYDRSDEQVRENSLLSCVIPPCDICQGIMKEASENVACSSCVKQTEEWPELVSPELSKDDSGLCGVCKWHRQEAKENEEEFINKAKPPHEDSTVGYFEKKVKKITKVTRTQSTDGTIREEKETITIRKMRYDPTETSFAHDDEYDTTSDDTLLETDEINEKTDASSEKNQVCCLRRSKSECCARMMNATPKKQSISMTNFEIL